MAWNVFKKKSDEGRAAVQPKGPSSVPEQVKAKDAAPQKVKAAVRSHFSASPYSLLLRPLATEKSLDLARRGVYAFCVKNTATKIEIKKAFSNLYGVMPTGVRVMNYDGKVVRFGRRKGVRSNSKKALITVPKGTTVDIS